MNLAAAVLHIYDDMQDSTSNAPIQRLSYKKAMAHFGHTLKKEDLSKVSTAFTGLDNTFQIGGLESTLHFSGNDGGRVSPGGSSI